MTYLPEQSLSEVHVDGSILSSSAPLANSHSPLSPSSKQSSPSECESVPGPTQLPSPPAPQAFAPPTPPLSATNNNNNNNSVANSNTNKIPHPRRSKQNPHVASTTIPTLSRKFVARRISEGETGRLKEELKCQACGKGYKHISSLAKHLWEHTPEWSMTSKLLISKHQQVQLLEAASILVSMNEEDEEEEGNAARTANGTAGLGGIIKERRERELSAELGSARSHTSMDERDAYFSQHEHLLSPRSGISDNISIPLRQTSKPLFKAHSHTHSHFSHSQSYSRRLSATAFPPSSSARRSSILFARSPVTDSLFNDSTDYDLLATPGSHRRMSNIRQRDDNMSDDDHESPDLDDAANALAKDDDGVFGDMD